MHSALYCRPDTKESIASCAHLQEEQVLDQLCFGEEERERELQLHV